MPKGSYQKNRYGLVASRFNQEVTKKLYEGALVAFEEKGVSLSPSDTVWVPGAFELPFMAKKMAQRGCFQAIVALGAIIRGETNHFDYVAREVSRGLLTVGLDEDLPVIFGVLTTETKEQAFARSGGLKGNKGAEAALAAMEMVSLLKL